jgi:hypothetical protein
MGEENIAVYSDLREINDINKSRKLFSDSTVVSLVQLFLTHDIGKGDMPHTKFETIFLFESTYLAQK